MNEVYFKQASDWIQSDIDLPGIVAAIKEWPSEVLKDPDLVAGDSPIAIVLADRLIRYTFLRRYPGFTIRPSGHDEASVTFSGQEEIKFPRVFVAGIAIRFNGITLSEMDLEHLNERAEKLTQIADPKERLEAMNELFKFRETLVERDHRGRQKVRLDGDEHEFEIVTTFKGNESFLEFQFIKSE